jgi:hypothetical protein
MSTTDDHITVTFKVPRTLSEQDRAALKAARSLYDGALLNGARPEDPGVLGGFGALHFAVQAAEWGTTPDVTRAWGDLEGALYPLGEYTADGGEGTLYEAYEAAVEKGSYDAAALTAATVEAERLVTNLWEAIGKLDSALAKANEGRA